MSQWSESIYSEPNTSRGSNHGFLSQLDECLYEGVPMDDPSLNAEARKWATRFLHLRVVGTKSTILSSKPQQGGVRWSDLSQNKLKTPTALSRPNETSSSINGSIPAVQHRLTSDRLPRLSNPKKK